MYFLVYTTLRMLNDKDIRIAQLILNPTIIHKLFKIKSIIIGTFFSYKNSAYCYVCILRRFSYDIASFGETFL